MKKMRFTNKGQAALEFIMTYGWAILVVLVAIGALAYFGVLSPDRLLPNKCLLTSGLSCDDSKVTSTGIAMRITNSLGQDLQNINLSFAKCPDADGLAAGPATLANGNSGTYTITCTTALSGTKISTNIYFNYTSVDTQISHAVSGNLIQKIE